MKNDNFDFFLSYSHSIELSEMIEIIDDFEECGIRIWIDFEHITAGTKISETFDYVLMKTRCWNGAIILIDSTYFNKSWCMKELNYFIDNSVPIFPFSYNYSIDEIVRQQSILNCYNIILLDKKIINPSYSFTMLKHIMNYIVSNLDYYFDTQNLSLIDPILYELWISFNQREILKKGKSTLKILKASSISHWVNYKYYSNVNIQSDHIMQIFYRYISFLHKKALSTNINDDKLLDMCIHKILCYMIKSTVSGI
ncbi:MAG: toll/interleukin-1 receptor domain-containing protein [Ruminococcus sp.]|nr:toll/interleukin-1 receptor domain-containing protein [Ruminococcus sp.]